MKINESNESGRLDHIAPRASNRSQTEAPGAAADRVSVTGTQSIGASVATAQRASVASRAELKAKVAAAVRSGTYKPDPQQIAEQILDDAELIARMQSLIQR